MVNNKWLQVTNFGFLMLAVFPLLTFVLPDAAAEALAFRLTIFVAPPKAIIGTDGDSCRLGILCTLIKVLWWG